MRNKLSLDPRVCRERGAALPLALAFLILFAVLIGLVFDFIHTGMVSSATLNHERNDVYAVNGAVDAAINRVRNDATLGTTGSATSCNMTGVSVNGALANVTCTPGTGSGQAIPTTAAPAFAILTMAPFIQTSPLTWSGNTPPGCVNVPPGELGVVQVQDSKLLTVTGNVYVNSDADSDVWSGGCPQTTTAKHIVVNGNVKQRSSCHDIDPINDSYNWLCGATSTQADPTPDPGLATHRDGPLGGAADTDLNDPAIAQPNSWALPFQTPPAVQTVPACSAGNVVTFNPGTYSDADALTNLMNGTTCPGRVFWFKPGAYYFNFTNTASGSNSGSHEWAINDGRAKVIGGQPTAVTIGGTSVGPTPWIPATATSTGFAPAASATTIDGATSDVQLGTITGGPTAWNPTSSVSSTLLPAGNGAVIDGAAATATLTGPSTTTANGLLSTNATNGTASNWSGLPTSVRTIGDGSLGAATIANATTQSVNLTGFATPATVPANATITSVTMNVAHNEGGNTNRVNTPTVTIGGCTTPALTKHGATATDAINVTTCLNTPALLNAIPTISYSVQHATGGANNGNETVQLDGITLNVSYTTPSANASASATLSGFSGAAIPPGATLTAVTMDVAHNEGTTSTTVINAPTVTLPGCTQTLTRRGTLGTDTGINVAGCFTVAQLNAGPTAVYAVSHATGSATAANVGLDGIRLNVSYSVAGTTGTASVSLSGYATNPLTTIPDDATITSVKVRAVHNEDNPALVNAPTVVITPANTAACPSVTLNKQATLAADNVDVTSCFSLPAQINNGVSLQYRITHCTGTANGCVAGTGTNAHLDGLYLDVTYVSNPRLPWDPNDPTANPNVPGACRHDGDPFWTDGVQWVFGGDSRINLKSGQMELCDKPSLSHADPSQDQQEIVLYGVRAAGAVTGPFAAATATNTTSGTDTGFDASSPNGASAAKAIDGTSAATSAFATVNSTRSLTLAGFTGGAGQVPTDATNISVALNVAHNEGSSTTPRNLVNPPAITITPGGGAGCTPLAVTKSTANNATPVTQTFADVATGCLNTPAKINGATIAYAVGHTATAGTATPTLDGITLTVTYTPAGGAGALNPESGCITQSPYYNPADHSPAYNGACALIRITRPPLSQTPPPGDIRKLTLWGTAYAPSAAFDLPVDLLPVPVFNRGVVARMLMLGYQVANSTQVPFTTVPLAGSTPQNRTATFTATMPGTATRVIANVEFCDNGCAGQPPAPTGSPVPVVVHSWKVTR